MVEDFKATTWQSCLHLTTKMVVVRKCTAVSISFRPLPKKSLLCTRILFMGDKLSMLGDNTVTFYWLRQATR